MAYGTLDIDMVAGPSEVLVIADETANPVYTAADLLSQAEHDVMASAVLLTTSGTLAEQVAAEIRRQTGYLSRREVIEQSLRDYGAILVCDDLDQCCRLANEIAPEHLEIMTAEPAALLPKAEKRWGHFPGGEHSGASGGLYGGAMPCAAYLGYGAVFLSAVRGELFEKDLCH